MKALVGFDDYGRGLNQFNGSCTDTAWSARQALKEHTGYGRSLVEEDFDCIVALVVHLGDAAQSSRK